MGIDADLLADVSNHRKLTKTRLLRLLQRAQFTQSIETFEMVQYVVLSYHHTRFNTFLAQITSMFAKAPAAVDKDALFLVMVDVWHYFPHVSLNGKSPAEIVDAGDTLGRWKTKPVRRSSR
jgi:hypothetical protein